MEEAQFVDPEEVRWDVEKGEFVVIPTLSSAGRAALESPQGSVRADQTDSTSVTVGIQAGAVIRKKSVLVQREKEAPRGEPSPDLAQETLFLLEATLQEVAELREALEQPPE